MPAAVPASRDSPEVWERRTGAACAPLVHYRRREPEKTILHQVVRDELEPFLAAARERSEHGRGLPAFVERELRAYLDCGMLARGFARGALSRLRFRAAGGVLLQGARLPLLRDPADGGRSQPPGPQRCAYRKPHPRGNA